MALVAALRLAQRGVGPGHVEDVVDDLKQHAELGRELVVGGCIGAAHSGYKQYALYRRTDEPPGLQPVQAPQILGGQLLSGDVEKLPADHPVDPGRARELGHRAQDLRRFALLVVEDMAEGLGVQRVAREDRDVLAEGDVRGRAAAAHVVVVHRRQVVVDERVGVDELERRREGQEVVLVAADRAGGGERQDRADALAACQQAVAHRLDEPCDRGVFGERQPVELVLDQPLQLVGVGHCAVGFLQERVLARQRLALGLAGAALQLGRGLRRQRRAVLDDGRGGVRAEVAGAQLLGGTLEAADEFVEGGVGVVHALCRGLSPISRWIAARMPLTNFGASAPE